MTRAATQEERWDRERDYRKHDFPIGPFVTWCFIDHDGERVCLIEYGDDSHFFSQELMIRL